MFKTLKWIYDLGYQKGRSDLRKEQSEEALAKEIQARIEQS